MTKVLVLWVLQRSQGYRLDGSVSSNSAAGSGIDGFQLKKEEEQ
jgi:hypothetical protein